MRTGTVGTTVERAVTEQNKDFAELMEKIANLEPNRRQQVIFYAQGFVAASLLNERDRAAIQ